MKADLIPTYNMFLVILSTYHWRVIIFDNII